MYFNIGSRLYRKWENLPDGDPDKAELERFLKVYEQAPLFLVGMSDEDLIIHGIDIPENRPDPIVSPLPHNGEATGDF